MLEQSDESTDFGDESFQQESDSELTEEVTAQDDLSDSNETE